MTAVYRLAWTVRKRHTAKATAWLGRPPRQKRTAKKTESGSHCRDTAWRRSAKTTVVDTSTLSPPPSRHRLSPTPSSFSMSPVPSVSRASVTIFTQV